MDFYSMDIADNLITKDNLNKLSFTTTLGRSLKKISLQDFPLETLMIDVSAYRAASRVILLSLGLSNVRFKSDDSVERKYIKTLNNGLGFTQCFNDLIGMRLRFDEYPTSFPDYFRVVDMRNGKKTDDGYRAIHLYYQRDNYSYPIEIQLWCGKDYYFNLWSHVAAYKYTSPDIGKSLYNKYSNGEIDSLEEFQTTLKSLEREA